MTTFASLDGLPQVQQTYLFEAGLASTPALLYLHDIHLGNLVQLTPSLNVSFE